MDVTVKSEVLEQGENMVLNPEPLSVIPYTQNNTNKSSSNEDSEQEFNGKRTRVSNDEDEVSLKKSKSENMDVVLPVGFLEPLPKEEEVEEGLPLVEYNPQSELSTMAVQSCKQFWKAGDYEGRRSGDSFSSSDPVVGIDHVRVHPKFLHSNATSHKWVLGAFAELLDNAMDEACNGATFVNVDTLQNKKDSSKMLLFEDNGGGMSPERMRHCMSLGYSVKSKLANTIGQYGNGFKTSTMRLGADVIVFSRCRGIDGKGPTQSIGLMSYTFLTCTGKEDIIVPMLDYEKKEGEWSKMVRSSLVDWDRNVDTIVKWSPYSSEEDLLNQFHLIKDQGTRVVVYNLWEDDQGKLELDFATDENDIQIRGVNRDEKKIEMAKKYPHSRHYMTYQHSLRSYASILYLRRPQGFRIILRGQEVEHHNIVDDMMMSENHIYRPTGVDGVVKSSDMFATVKLGFVKDAKDHIDIQGFNVYHKNRLIKPFWRVWNAAGSSGRGVIGVLEANFVEPAHDKQGFERTIVLTRLEARLVQIQKQYWTKHSHEIGYAGVNKKRVSNGSTRVVSPERNSYPPREKIACPALENSNSIRAESTTGREPALPSQIAANGTRNSAIKGNGSTSSSEEAHKNWGPFVLPIRQMNENGSTSRTGEAHNSWAPFVLPNRQVNNTIDGNGSTSHPEATHNNPISFILPIRQVNGSSERTPVVQNSSGPNGSGQCPRSNPVGLNSAERFPTELQDLRDARNVLGVQANGQHNFIPLHLNQLKVENDELKDRLKKMEKTHSIELETEREKKRLLEARIAEWEEKYKKLDNEQEKFIGIFSEERSRRDTVEKNLKNRLQDKSNTILELQEKVTKLERMMSNPISKTEE